MYSNEGRWRCLVLGWTYTLSTLCLLVSCNPFLLYCYYFLKHASVLFHMQRSNPGSLCLLQALVPSEARVCWEYWGWGHSFSLKLFTGVIFLVCVQWALLGFPALHLRERQNQLDMVYVLVKLFICHSHWLEHWIYRRNCGTKRGRLWWLLNSSSPAALHRLGTVNAPRRGEVAHSTGYHGLCTVECLLSCAI